MTQSFIARPGRAWAVFATLLAVGAAIGWFAPRVSIDWQPALFASAPWRAFTAIGVHYNALHLTANVAGAAAVGVLGVAARAPRAATFAWAAAWPLTQIGLLVEPGLVHYGGLSGVLHAGVAVIALWLLSRPTRERQRVVGTALLAGLLLKVALEAPWGEPLRPVAGWGIATAPMAHASGLAAGLVCAGVALWIQSRADQWRTDQSNTEHV